MRFSSILYWVAAGLCSLGAAAHEIVGAPKVLEPLAQSGLPQDVIWLHHFSWHVGTVAVLIMAGMFIAASRSPAGRILGVFATAMSAGFAALGIGLALLGDEVLWTTPAPYPWTLIALIGVVAVFKTPRDAK
ncbi:MAG: hypothetical protein AAFZ74_05365 [Pseudomonadota bacterium]